MEHSNRDSRSTSTYFLTLLTKKLLRHSPPISFLAQSLVFCVVFCRSLFVLLSVFVGHGIVSSSSIYEFWWLLWYLQTYVCQRKRIKGQTMIYRTLHRKLKIEQQEPH
jgi:hypothetical protein